MPTETIVLPGDSEIIESQLPNDSGTIKVGPSIFSNPVTTPVTDRAGYFKTNKLKKGSLLYVDSANKRVCACNYAILVKNTISNAAFFFSFLFRFSIYQQSGIV